MSRRSKKEFAVDEEVRAKWPGSSLWFKATVLNINDDDISLKFEDGTEEIVKSKDISKTKAFRSRSRSKSPGRRRSRSRSPARRKVSPARQKASPGRQKKVSQSPARQLKQKEVRKDNAAEDQTDAPAETPTRRSSKRIVTSISQATTETRTYGTRSAVKAGKQTIDVPLQSFSSRVAKTTHYEFGGPIGATFTVVFLPLFMYYLYFVCGKEKCELTLKPDFSKNWKDYYDFEAYMIFLGWMVFQAALYILPIGKVCQGQQLKNGSRLQYRLNGFFAFFVSVAVFFGLYHKGYSVTVVYNKFLPLMTASILFSFVMSVLLYIKSMFVPNNQLAPGGNSHCTIYDFFIGHELNPRIGSFDLKFFCELRPGLIGWVLIDMSFLLKAFEKGSAMDNLPLIILVCFHTLYVADALWFEDAILTTMDITSDGFGFMLVFGDLAWVPFVYSLQARYLVDNSLKIAYRNYYLAAVVCFGLIGYYIFRSSNLQKNMFRKNPNNPSLQDLETIQTPNKKLLVGGWWGWVQHPNYLGDILMAFSWSLCCGFQSVIVYYYPFYLTGLLIHRQRRDDHHCHQKYGAAWDKYTQRVPYRIFPKVY
ncbi:delta(14)-sterol reductase TM7SF2-like [Anneissia japonica]|uniref:delta(14)-sterol reductase TM7SF2-like n=1 Tax=Anneissia japonica TaxID=1529436 RepID=UPI001425908D|nr:delta(14)-sterol reductase TM7SF2-like [Anneissia japonica]XP_033103943.1 delta(14)-sterol reductase TM7SF2-like [Anneissia japonica]XP_033103944.1 delta(14)-sterol reductase TM7SF2-like [Anneissia japonica]XP_033103945.1 delta(14)-sterol reductase TM7SF2-like [Anneissia japonica]